MKTTHLQQKVRYALRGRPTPNTPIAAIQWQILVEVVPDWERKDLSKQLNACFVLATHIPLSQLTSQQGIAAYKGQGAIERGVGFLKDPLFFTSSLFVKTPCRIQGLLVVMTMALLVYSIATRRLRHRLKQIGASIPNQIGQPSSAPTLRWVFQLLEGIDRVVSFGNSATQEILLGITPAKNPPSVWRACESHLSTFSLTMSSVSEEMNPPNKQM